MIGFKAFVQQLNEVPEVMDRDESEDFRVDSRNDIASMNKGKVGKKPAKFTWGNFKYFESIDDYDDYDNADNWVDLSMLDGRQVFVKHDNKGNIQYAANIKIHKETNSIYQTLLARGRRAVVDWGEILDGLIVLSKKLGQSGKVTSSSLVTIGGKKMWENLANIALSKGYKLSVYSERTKKSYTYDKSQGDVRSWFVSKDTWNPNNRIVISPYNWK